MITARIKDTKNNLSRYLALVKAGEDVVFTEHGKVKRYFLDQRLAQAAREEGLVAFLKTEEHLVSGNSLCSQPDLRFFVSRIFLIDLLEMLMLSLTVKKIIFDRHALRRMKDRQVTV